MIQPVDLDHLNEISDNDPEFRDELISVYLSDTERLLGELSKAVESSRLDEIVAIAHSVRGASANVGAPLVEGAAFLLEQEGAKLRDQSADNAPPDCDEFHSNVMSIKEAFFSVKSFFEEA